MISTRSLGLFCVALATSPAIADWQPQWRGLWQHPEAFRAATPLDVRVASDGEVFALLDIAHHGMGHAALARFDDDGAFTWLRERAAGAAIGAEVLADGRVAVVDNFGLKVRIRVFDGHGGDVSWEDESRSGRLAAGQRRVVQAANGNILLAAVDGDDLVVLRYSASGSKLPSWRWSPGHESLQVDDVVAAPDGGVVVGAAGDPFSGGYLVVRFDASGHAVFSDRELGDHGTSLDILRVAIDASGDVFAAGAPENAQGAPQSQVWKLGADGTRIWTRVLANPEDSRLSATIESMVLTLDGDPVVAIDFGDYGGFHLQRLSTASGATVRSGVAPIGGLPTGMAQATNGRVLVTGYRFIDSQGHIGATIAEFDSGLRPCRSLDLSHEFFGASVTGGDQGWTVLAGTLHVPGVGSDAWVLRYDADGACDAADAVFADGFDPPASPLSSPRGW